MARKIPDLLRDQNPRGKLTQDQAKQLAVDMTDNRLTPEAALSLRKRGVIDIPDEDTGRVIESPADLGRRSVSKQPENTRFKGPRLDFSGSDFWSNGWDFKKNRGKEDPDFRKVAGRSAVPEPLTRGQRRITRDQKRSK
jgi:hypothetical protein